MQTFNSLHKTFKTDDWIGLLVFGTIFSLWFASLFALLTIPLSDISWLWLIGFILGRTYLHTGLFILAHDSMHGNLIPHSRSLNNLIGRLAVWVYGFLPYDHCYVNHSDHHHYPSQIGDPDFHGAISHPLFWYGKFIREYFPIRSLIIFIVNMSVIFWGSALMLNVSFINLFIFWLLPLVLSSSQLFFFGTYLPHRQTAVNLNFSPRLNSSYYSIFWAFFSCYNFGHYHWEHHEYPKTPWYKLHNIHLQPLSLDNENT